VYIGGGGISPEWPVPPALPELLFGDRLNGGMFNEASEWSISTCIGENPSFRRWVPPLLVVKGEDGKSEMHTNPQHFWGPPIHRQHYTEEKDGTALGHNETHVSATTARNRLNPKPTAISESSKWPTLGESGLSIDPEKENNFNPTYQFF